MEEVLITYPSKNATSREAAFSLARGFEEAGSNVNLESPSSILAEKLKDYDLIVVMGSTRGCLHCEVCKNCPLKEMRIFLYRMSHGIKLTGLRAVVIGLHPSSHHAMKATKIFTKALQKVKMQVIYQETLPANLSHPLDPQTRDRLRAIAIKLFSYREIPESVRGAKSTSTNFPVRRL